MALAWEQVGLLAEAFGLFVSMVALVWERFGSWNGAVSLICLWHLEASVF
jgi:hypothetical protein